MIYVIRTKDGRFAKIDFSDNEIRLKHRLAVLRTGCPLKLEVLAIGKGSLEDEQKILNFLSPYNVHGEWFRARSPTVTIFCNLASVTSPVDAFHEISTGIYGAMKKILRTQYGTSVVEDEKNAAAS